MRSTAPSSSMVAAITERMASRAGRSTAANPARELNTIKAVALVGPRLVCLECAKNGPRMEPIAAHMIPVASTGSPAILAQAMPWGIASRETFTAAFKSARNASPE